MGEGISIELNKLADLKVFAGGYTGMLLRKSIVKPDSDTMSNGIFGL